MMGTGVGAGQGRGSKPPPPALPLHVNAMMADRRKRATMIGAASGTDGQDQAGNDQQDQLPAQEAMGSSGSPQPAQAQPLSFSADHAQERSASPSFTLLPPPGGRKRSIASQIFQSTNAQTSPEKATTHLPTSVDPNSSLTAGHNARGANRRSDIMSFASMFSDGSFDDDSIPFAAARQALERVGMIKETVQEENQNDAEHYERGAGQQEEARGVGAGELQADGDDEGEGTGQESAQRRPSQDWIGSAADSAPPRPPRRQATLDGGDGQTVNELRDGEGVDRRAFDSAISHTRTSSARSGGSTPSSATAPGAPVAYRSIDLPLPVQTSSPVPSAKQALQRDARSSTVTAASVDGEMQKLETSIGQLRLANPDDASETASSKDPLSPTSPTSPAEPLESGGQLQDGLPPLSVTTTATAPYDSDFTPSAPGSYVDHSFGHSEADTPVSCKILTPHTGSEAQDHAQSRAGSPGPGLVTPLAMSRDPSSQGDLHMGPKSAPGGFSKDMRSDTDQVKAVLGSPFPPVDTPNGTPILAALPPRKASATGLMHPAVSHNLDQRRPSADHGLAASATDASGRSPVPSPSLLAGATAGAAATPPMGHAQWTPVLNGGSPVIGAGSNSGSPHSAAATRQAVEMGKNTPPVTRGQRSATLTLVGSTTVDLAASRGPVPIMFTVGDPAQAHIMREGARLREAAAAAAGGAGGGGGAGIGLGLPSNLSGSGRVSPSAASPVMSYSPFGDDRRPSSPLVAMALAPPFMEDTAAALKSAPSPYPQMQVRSATLPISGMKGQGGSSMMSNGAGTMPASPVIGDFGNLRYPSPHAASMSAAAGRGSPNKAPAQTTGALAGPSRQRSDSNRMPQPTKVEDTRRPSASQMVNPAPSNGASVARGSPGPINPPGETAETNQAESKGKSGIFQRQRSRSFSAAMNKALGRKSGTGTADAPALPPSRPPPPPAGLDMPAALARTTERPASPTTSGPGANGLGQRPAFARQASLPNQSGHTSESVTGSVRSPPPPPINTSAVAMASGDMVSPRTVPQQNGNASPRVRSPISPAASQKAPSGSNFTDSDAPRKGSTPTVIIPHPDRSESPAPISPPPARPESPSVVGLHPQAAHSAQGTPSSIRTASGSIGGFTFRRPSGAKGSKTSIGSNGPATPTGRASPLPMPSPVSHKDFIREEAKSTIKEDGVAFEMIQPKRSLPPNGSGGSDEGPLSLSPQSNLLSSPDKLGSFNPSATSLDTLSVLGGGSSFHGHGDELERRPTINTMKSSQSGMSARTLPETDEWGFVLSMGTTPEIYLGRAGGSEQRANEMKWVSVPSYNGLQRGHHGRGGFKADGAAGHHQHAVEWSACKASSQAGNRARHTGQSAGQGVGVVHGWAHVGTTAGAVS